MNISEYQKKSIRTLNHSLTDRDQLACMGMGISGEGSEVTDEIKKHLYQGHDLDVDHIAEEMGDVMFYMVNLATLLDIDFQDVLDGNHEKLMDRFPKGFDKDKSINRKE